MAWARIVIEFPPDRHDPNDVMLFLTDHFKGDDGVPTATITFEGIGPDETELPVVGGSGTAEQLADYYWANCKPKKIEAIKSLRQDIRLPSRYASLNVAKALIEDAAKRNP